MRIIINPVVNKEVSAFEKTEWVGVYKDYFGHDVPWTNESLHFKATDSAGNMLGTITFEFEGGVLFINTLIIGKEYRGMGIGEKLMTYTERWAKKNKAHKIYLFVQKGWRAIDFYKKLGFTKSAVLKDHFMHEDFFIYHKYL